MQLLVGTKQEWGSLEHQRAATRRLGLDPDAYDGDDLTHWGELRRRAYQSILRMDTDPEDRSLWATIFGWD